MPNYYLNSQAQQNGDHEVHLLICEFLPPSINRVLLGTFNSCDEAIDKAKEKFHPSKVNGCSHCANLCHTN